MKKSRHPDELHHICKNPKDISIYTHIIQNTERSVQSKGIPFGAHFQYFLSRNMKYFAFEHLCHNLYLSLACKHQLQNLKAYIQLDLKYELNLISLETA